MRSEVEVDVTIVGGGVVGLAIAEALSRRRPDASIVIIERNARLGAETSARSSEVIHAGLYYDGAPLKARTCVEGNRLLYEFCAAHGVPHRACGKYIVAFDDSEVATLVRILETARGRGVPVRILGPDEAHRATGCEAALLALSSPATGIVDSHELLARLASLLRGRGVIVRERTTFVGVDEVLRDACVVRVQEKDGGVTAIRTRAFLNAAGLGAGRIANAFLPQSAIEIRPCRGRYFALSSRWTNRFESLLYGVPNLEGGLGVHLAFDLTGRSRLGPDVDWSRASSHAPDDPALFAFDSDVDALKQAFLAAGRRLIPALDEGDLSPDFVGVRPKLFVRGELQPDFAILRGGDERPDWHLLGIESPGLTAALAIAGDLASDVAVSCLR